MSDTLAMLILNIGGTLLGAFLAVGLMWMSELRRTRRKVRAKEAKMKAKPPVFDYTVAKSKFDAEDQHVWYEGWSDGWPKNHHGKGLKDHLGKAVEEKPFVPWPQGPIAPYYHNYIYGKGFSEVLGKEQAIPITGAKATSVKDHLGKAIEQKPLFMKGTLTDLPKTTVDEMMGEVLFAPSLPEKLWNYSNIPAKEKSYEALKAIYQKYGDNIGYEALTPAADYFGKHYGKWQKETEEYEAFARELEDWIEN